MKTASEKKGIIIIDILLALSLATFFTALITESSFTARDMFERAKLKSLALDSFEDGMVGNSTTTGLRIQTRLFGNDLVEKDIDSNGVLFSSIGLASSTYSGDYSRYSGTPFCSVDFTNREEVGSYSFLREVWGIGKDSDLNSIGETVTSDLSKKINSSNIRIEPITLPIDSLLPLTDLEVRNGIAYVSTDSNIASDPDLFVIDIRNKDHPTVLSSINTGPGISAITLAGKRVFAAAASTAYQLHIIRMDSLGSLILENKFKLPLTYATATPAFGSSIFYKNGLVYLGTEKWDGDEFTIIDVNDLITPIKIGGFETGSKVNDIYIRNNLAYVADSDSNQLRILDLNNIANPTNINSFSSSGGNRQEGKVISLFEDLLSLGRTSGGFDIASDHEIFTFASTSSTTLTQYDSSNIPGGVYGIVADRSNLYLATRDVNREFHILNSAVWDSKSNEVQTGLGMVTDLSFSLPVAPQTITCDNEYLYILAHSAPVIYRISFK